LVLGGVLFLLPKGRRVDNLVERTKFQFREAVEPIVKPQPTLKPSPTAKVLTGGYQTFQTFNNCGPASLSMTLSYFDIDKSQHELGDLLRPYQHPTGDNDDKSVTLPELAHLAESYGFLAYGRPNGNMELIREFINNDMPVIARTWTKVNEDIGHYRVIKGYDEARGVIIQDDSLQGANLEFSYESFNALWEAFNYEYLVLVPPEKQEIAEVILGENVSEAIAWQNALKLSDAALAKNPGSIYAQFNRSVALYHLGQYQESVQAFEAVENKLPFRMLWYQIEPFLAYQKLGQDERVLSMTQKVLDNHNRAFSEAYQIRGEVYQTLGKNDLAQEEFAKVLLYNKNFFKYWQ
jgi:tetratricopeptide (TPR) repeat protein